MSVDGTGGIAAGNADLAALVDAELAQLAADAQALRALLVEDAVVTARVLPSNGLTDLIEIAGRRVAASLPPTVRPGDVLQVQVTGFDGDRILMQIVGTDTPVAVEATPGGVPVAPDPAVFVQASIQPAPPLAEGAPTTPGAAAAPPPPAGPAAPVTPPAVPPARPAVGAAFSSVVARANVATPEPTRAGAVPEPGRTNPVPGAPRIEPPLEQPPVQNAAVGAAARSAPVRPVAMPPETTSIEARLDASRASASSAPASDARAAAEPARAAGAPPARFVAPPVVAAKGAAALPAAARATPATYAEPAALLRALRLPVTPTNVAAATTALQRPGALPGALAALERALPSGAGDAAAATLRTLIGFVGRIDPRSPVLGVQIAAYVDQIVAGAEPKLATLLGAHAVADATTNAPAAPRADGTPGGGEAASTRAAAPAGPASPTPPIAAAVGAARSAALAVDLKQTLLTLAADPAAPASAAPAIAGALTALTAAQVSAAQALAANPNGLTFSIPLATAHGTATAQIAISRDAPDRGGAARPDASNFRIAFVLETAHYGTVAIDLVTVGREVSVDVRTESAPAMRAFRDALGGLVDRLESLRYRVASADAAVGPTSTVAVEAPPAAAPDPDAAVDRSA